MLVRSSSALLAAFSLLSCSAKVDDPGSGLETVSLVTASATAASPVVPSPSAVTPAATTAPQSPAVSGSSGPVTSSTTASSVVSPVATTTGASSASASPSNAPTTAPVSTVPAVVCTDTVPDDRQTCATWKDWGECENDWLKTPGFCNATCGRCDSTAPVGTSPGPSPNPSSSSSTTPPANSSGLGNDNPYAPITSGGDGFATRYWDCSKQSCGWNANAGGNAVKSCGRDGNSLGVTDAASGSAAFTCFSFAPWAHSTEVSYGFAATHVSNTCGKCYQLQFTGAGNSNPNDPGANAIKGKTMVVMASNIGGDVGGNQLDLLVPGGGEGAVNSCPAQGIPASNELYGGFLKKCGNASDLNARKECVRQRCNTDFADSKYADMKKGCLWFVDWLQTADNPKYVSKEISCPQELKSAAR
jgi:Glycosyl hydrolase family 45